MIQRACSSEREAYKEKEKRAQAKEKRIKMN